MVEQFADMLAEVRAYGEGLAIVEQIPTKILPDAVKNTATKVAHRVPSADDREVLAGAMNLTKPAGRRLRGPEPGRGDREPRRGIPCRSGCWSPTSSGSSGSRSGRSATRRSRGT